LLRPTVDAIEDCGDTLCAGVDGRIDAALSTGTALFSIAVMPPE
jgi:hypothetical protein